MKNHFFFSYSGNKRTEVKNIYVSISLNEEDNTFNNPKIKTIIEPYCGSSAISYYIWTKHGDKFNYILNDGDTILIELYKILQDVDKTNELQHIVNKTIQEIREEPDEAKRKILYNKINIKTVEGFYIKSKFHSIRIGLFPRNNKWKDVNLHNSPIINFIRNPYVKISNRDGLDLTMELDKDDSNLIILDPPYLFTCNSEYGTGSLSSFKIYEYLTKRPPDAKAHIFAILENMWFINFIYPHNKKIVYKKQYTGFSHKISEHVVIKF